jgi:FAD/FMN-containing dehydrogenase
MIQDAVVPRSRLPEVLSSVYAIANKYNLLVANVFHAGDGNLHPLICFDSRFADQVTRVKEAGRELMQVCVSAGGTITGEHGVGLDKRELLPLVFSDADMNTMLRVRAAFDPLGLCNPGKIIPMLRGCGEGRAVASESTFTRSDSNDLAVVPTNTTGEAKRTSGPFNVESAVLRIGDMVGNDHVVIHKGTVVTQPSSGDEVVELVKLASHEGWTITPAGNMTWMPKSSATNLVISTCRLNRIIEHEPADLIAMAESGVRLADFNQQLSQNGQWLPLDPPDNGRATLGGVVATGLGGAQQFAYGRPRGTVIGMKVVLADGSLIKAGGRVVKNVAGYDLCKLFTGSYGTLGIITQLNFKLRPRPIREQTIVAVGRESDLISRAQGILNSRLFPVGLELLSSALANLIGIAAKEDSSVLLVRFAGNEKGVRYQTEQALVELSKNQPEVEEHDVELWSSLAAVPLKESSSSTWRASVLPDRVDTLIDALADVYGTSFNSSVWQLGVADGRMRMMRCPGCSTDKVREVVDSLGGNFIMAGVASDMGSTTALARRVKHQLDPDGVFPNG